MLAKIPKTVLLSVVILLAVHTLGLWQMVLLSQTLGVPMWMPYSTLIFTYSLLFALLYMVLIGRSWARTTYTVLAVFSLLFLVGSSTSFGAIGFTVIAAKLVAVVMLYFSPDDSWFNTARLT